MSSDDPKKLILARRARFVAAALAGMSIACGKEKSSPPEPCLSVPIQRADAEAPPGPCLAAPLDWKERWDAGGATDGSTTTPTTTFDASVPMPCLSVVAPPPDAGTKKK